MVDRMHAIVARWVRERGATSGTGAHPAKLATLLSERPHLPSDYVEFVRTYGWLWVDVRAVESLGASPTLDDVHDQFYITHISAWDDAMRSHIDAFFNGSTPFLIDGSIILSDIGNGDYRILAVCNGLYRVFHTDHELGEVHLLANTFAEWLEEAFRRKKWNWRQG